MKKLLKILLKGNGLEVFVLVVICVVIIGITILGWVYLPFEARVSIWGSIPIGKLELLIGPLLAVLIPWVLLVRTPLRTDVAHNMSMNQLMYTKEQFDWKKENLEYYFEVMTMISVCAELILASIFILGRLGTFGYSINPLTAIGIPSGIGLIFIGRYFRKVANRYKLAIRSDWVGIHTAKSLSDKSMWTRLHLFTGNVLIVLGVVMAGVCAGVSFVSLPSVYVVGALIVLIGATTIILCAWFVGVVPSRMDRQFIHTLAVVFWLFLGFLLLHFGHWQFEPVELAGSGDFFVGMVGLISIFIRFTPAALGLVCLVGALIIWPLSPGDQKNERGPLAWVFFGELNLLLGTSMVLTGIGGLIVPVVLYIIDQLGFPAWRWGDSRIAEQSGYVFLYGLVQIGLIFIGLVVFSKGHETRLRPTLALNEDSDLLRHLMPGLLKMGIIFGALGGFILASGFNYPVRQTEPMDALVVLGTGIVLGSLAGVPFALAGAYLSYLRGSLMVSEVKQPTGNQFEVSKSNRLGDDEFFIIRFSPSRIIVAKTGHFSNLGSSIISQFDHAPGSADIFEAVLKRAENNAARLAKLTDDQVLKDDKSNFQIENSAIQSIELDTKGVPGILIYSSTKTYEFTISEKRLLESYKNMIRSTLGAKLICK